MISTTRSVASTPPNSSPFSGERMVTSSMHASRVGVGVKVAVGRGVGVKVGGIGVLVAGEVTLNMAEAQVSNSVPCPAQAQILWSPADAPPGMVTFTEKFPGLKVPNICPLSLSPQMILYGLLLPPQFPPETVTVLPGGPEDGFRFIVPAPSGAACASDNHHPVKMTAITMNELMTRNLPLVFKGPPLKGNTVPPFSISRSNL